MPEPVSRTGPRAAATGPADLVLRDAPLYRRGAWDGDRVAVRDGVIVGVGDERSIEHLVGPRTEVRSLAGRWLLPAFHDAHVHPVAGGLEMGRCNLTEVTTLADYQRLVGAYAAEHPDLEWVTGGGWSMTSFPGGVPRAADLDAVVADRPVYLPNRDHHSAWVNSRALELAGIDEHTPDPGDGRIERDARGRPTGALHEGAMALVGRLVPAPSSHELREGLRTAQRHLASLGIVGWQDALVGEALGMQDTLDTYVDAVARGELHAKVVLALWWDRSRGLEQLPDLLHRRELAASAGLRATSIKIMQDGVCETHTAALLESYLGTDGRPTGNHGLSFINRGDLAAYVTALDAQDFQVHLHALGDRAVRDSLDAIAHAANVNGRRGNRHHLAHLQVVHEDDVPRFADLDVTANAQPLWACRDEAVEELTLPFLPASMWDRQYVFGSLLRAGARLACGSDWPISSADPLEGMHVAVNRREPGDPGADPLLPAEALTIQQAIAGYTTGAARVNGLEDVTGRIEVGYAADLVALDGDILGGDCAIADLSVTHTFADGREVHAR